jgi:hypothetical protein
MKYMITIIGHVLYALMYNTHLSYLSKLFCYTIQFFFLKTPAI